MQGATGVGGIENEPERRTPARRAPRVRGALGSPPGVREGSRGVQGEARAGRGWKTRGAPPAVTAGLSRAG